MTRLTPPNPEDIPRIATDMRNNGIIMAIHSDGNECTCDMICNDAELLTTTFMEANQ